MRPTTPLVRQVVDHLNGFLVALAAVLVELPTHLAETFSDARRHRGFNPRPVALELIDDQRRDEQLEVAPLDVQPYGNYPFLAIPALGEVEPC